jgi:hypothetical protein
MFIIFSSFLIFLAAVSHPPVLVLVVALFQELTEISEAFSEVLR